MEGFSHFYIGDLRSFIIALRHSFANKLMPLTLSGVDIEKYDQIKDFITLLDIYLATLTEFDSLSLFGKLSSTNYLAVKDGYFLNDKINSKLKSKTEDLETLLIIDILNRSNCRLRGNGHIIINE